MCLCDCVYVCVRLNEDEFLPVDLCVMLGHQNIAQVLLRIGAKDSPKCKILVPVLRIKL